MKTVILRGEKINDESDFHREISAVLEFGPYYGENLDALWDCLSYDVEGPILIIWINSLHSKAQLGETFDTIVNIFKMIKKQDVDVGLVNRLDFSLQ